MKQPQSAGMLLRGMAPAWAPVVVLLLLALAGAESADVPVDCKQTVAGNKIEYKYKCTFCNPMGYALRFPRLSCTNFSNSTRRNNIGFTSPSCYITQFNRIDPQTCTDFSFRAPLTGPTIAITFDNTPADSTIETPVTGEERHPQQGKKGTKERRQEAFQATGQPGHVFPAVLSRTASAPVPDRGTGPQPGHCIPGLFCREQPRSPREHGCPQ